MAHAYSTNRKAETKQNNMTKPKRSTVAFIRQFARAYVKVQNCPLGAMVIN